VAQEDEKFEVSLSEAQKKAISELLELVKPFANAPSSPENAKALQSKVFDVARNNSIEPKEFFTMLYRMFLNADRGPRIGNYFLDLGIDRVAHVLGKYLA
jgi:lysyl-tRNA synthetase class 1